MGEGHTCAVMTAGGVKCWGSNLYGQLGTGRRRIGAPPVDVIGLSGVTAVDAGGDNGSCALTSGGAVKCWGSNSLGQLGSGAPTNAANGEFTVATTPVDVAGLSSGALGDRRRWSPCLRVDGGLVLCSGVNRSRVPRHRQSADQSQHDADVA